MPDPDKAPIQFIGHLQRLDLKPGDKFVLTVDEVLSHQTSDRLHLQWIEFVGGCDQAAIFPLLILQRGMKLGVVNAEALKGV